MIEASFNSPQNDLLTTDQAAASLRVSRKVLEKWRVIGGGPRFIKVGRLVRYRQADLEAYLDARVRCSTSDRGEAAA